MEEFRMERVTFNITCSCNLKCRLCGAYICWISLFHLKHSGRR